MAKVADHNGLDFVFPVARWRGMGGPSDYWGISLEAFTLAAGLSEATERLGIDLSGLPNLMAYKARVAARPKVKEALTKEGLLKAA